MKQICIGFVALLLFGGVELCAASPLDEVNVKVERIDKRIENGDKTLPSLETSYDFKDTTEGVPPKMSFFFDIETKKLLACFVWVGHETWSRKFAYYFDDREELMKYMEIIPPPNLGVSPSRKAIIYGEKGKVLWENHGGHPRQEPEMIKALYQALQKAGDEFAP